MRRAATEASDVRVRRPVGPQPRGHEFLALAVSWNVQLVSNSSVTVIRSSCSSVSCFWPYSSQPGDATSETSEFHLRGDAGLPGGVRLRSLLLLGLRRASAIPPLGLVLDHAGPVGHRDRGRNRLLPAPPRDSATPVSNAVAPPTRSERAFEDGGLYVSIRVGPSRVEIEENGMFRLH